MVVGKFVSKLVQSLPSWEVTKYYGRVAWFQLQCLKYRIQTSETWFNFMNKFMPGKLKNEAEYKNKIPGDREKQIKKSGTDNKSFAKVPKCSLLTEKLENLGTTKKKHQQEKSCRQEEEGEAVEICIKSDRKKSKKKNVDGGSKTKSKK